MSSQILSSKSDLISYLCIQRCLDHSLCKLQMEMPCSILTVTLLPDTTVAVRFFLSGFGLWTENTSSYKNHLQSVFCLGLFAPLFISFLTYFSPSISSRFLPLVLPVTNWKARLEDLSFAVYWAINLWKIRTRQYLRKLFFIFSLA